MIRPESGGSDCTMEAGFRENSVYSTYTHTANRDNLIFPEHGVNGRKHTNKSG